MTGRLKPFGDLGTVIPEKVQKLNLFDRISIYILRYPSNNCVKVFWNWISLIFLCSKLGFTVLDIFPEYGAFLIPLGWLELGSSWFSRSSVYRGISSQLAMFNDPRGYQPIFHWYAIHIPLLFHHTFPWYSLFISILPPFLRPSSAHLQPIFSPSAW